MLRRRFSLRALFAILTVAAIVFASLPSPSRPLTQRHFAELEFDMSKAEVEALLGGSARNEIRRAMIWVPNGVGRQISYQVEPKLPSVDFFRNDPKRNGYQKVWITETGLIAIYFGPDDRLRLKYFSSVHTMGPPTIMNWLLSRPAEIRKSLGLSMVSH
jgi:hypothetical protein